MKLPELSENSRICRRLDFVAAELAVIIVMLAYILLFALPAASTSPVSESAGAAATSEASANYETEPAPGVAEEPQPVQPEANTSLSPGGAAVPDLPGQWKESSEGTGATVTGGSR